MKKMLISATLLLVSFSSFSYENNSDLKANETLQANQVGDIFSEFLPTGKKVGICEIKQSRLNVNNEYIIEVKEGLGLIGIYHNVKYVLKTPSTIKYDNNAFTITNTYKFTEAGQSGLRGLQMKAKRLENGELKIYGIFIETRNKDKNGESAVNIEQSVHCLNRT